MVALLLAHGADCNATAAGGETPLLVAARAQSYRVTAALLSEPGVDADAADKHGLTPLMAAAAMGNELLVAALLAVGADPTVACSPGASNSQLFEAFRVRIKHRETTVEEGQRKGVKGTRPALLHICIGASPGGAQGTRLATANIPETPGGGGAGWADGRRADEGGGSTALHSPPSPFASPRPGSRSTALHRAVRAGHLAATAALLRHRRRAWMVDVEDAAGWTPLAHAVSQRNTRLVTALVEAVRQALQEPILLTHWVSALGLRLSSART